MQLNPGPPPAATARMASYFNERAANYEHSNIHNWVAEQVVMRTGISAGDVVLDVATGTGLGARAVARLTAASRIVGIDISPAMLTTFRERAPDGALQLVLADAHHLPFHSSTFDDVMCIASLEYLTDPGLCGKEWVRVSRPGGRVVFTVFM